MTQELSIAGGGMAGLAAAVAASRAGWQARLFEQSAQFSEAGAGLQLGPNATRVLRNWDLLQTVSAHAAFPGHLRVRDALSGHELGSMALGDDMVRRHGAPYATVHRADLHTALLDAAASHGCVMHLGVSVRGAVEAGDALQIGVSDGREVETDALAGTDGLWSAVRAMVCGDAPPRPTGHLAYRVLLRQADLPARLRSQDVTAWLGPHLHLVAYPVRAGEALNVACFVEGHLPGDTARWDIEGAGVAAQLQAAMGTACAPLRDLIGAGNGWKMWVLHDRPPLAGAAGMASGRIALLGDAAHPMLPYLAQGAGMAIEDAAEIGRVLASADGRVMDVPTALQRYALNRWQRCARVQARSQRNGQVFHARGPLRVARNLSLRLLGDRLLDMPWLYRAPGDGF